MNSKEALKDIFDILVNFERLSDIHDDQDIKKQKFEIIEKDLDLLEEYRKLEEEICVCDKDTKNEINTTSYEIAEVEVEND